ncbi:MAG: hypothetical protein MJ241_00075 [Bacilli bacterium]|nr:hypothetical protein [Bacilli bacterium]
MGRKAVPNAELKIYREVINLSKSHSIRKIATVDIAYRLKVSETVIFKRFNTKEDLLLKSFLYCFEQLGDVDFNVIFDETKTKELRLVEFTKIVDAMSLRKAESNYISMYMMSEYFELSHLEKVANFDLLKIRNLYSSISGGEFQLFVQQSIISLITYASLKSKVTQSDAFAMSLLPEVQL